MLNLCVFYLIVNMCIIIIVAMSLLIIIFISPPLSFKIVASHFNSDHMHKHEVESALTQ